MTEPGNRGGPPLGHDQTGDNATLCQTGKVWFLAGTMEYDWDGVARATRDVTVWRGAS